MLAFADLGDDCRRMWDASWRLALERCASRPDLEMRVLLYLMTVALMLLMLWVIGPYSETLVAIAIAIPIATCMGYNDENEVCTQPGGM